MAIAETIRPTPARVEFSRVNMPLLHIVPERHIRGVPSPELVSVAGHELNHALVALAYGVPIVSLSVKPEGNSLGRTILGGIVDMETMKVISAGGGVHTHQGHAEGYGSDKYKVDFLYHSNGGDSWDRVIGRAANIISRYSNKVRERAAEIVAHLKELRGSIIYELLLRAEMEINEENHVKKELEIQTFLIPQVQSENKTIIDSLRNNMYRITYVVIGKENKEEMFCGVCKSVNGHLEKCPNVKLKEGSKGNPFSLPKMNTIYSPSFSKN